MRLIKICTSFHSERRAHCVGGGGGQGLGQTLISAGLLLSGQGLGTLAIDAIWIGESFSLQEEMLFCITLPAQMYGTPAGTVIDTGLLECLGKGKTFLGLLSTLLSGMDGVEQKVLRYKWKDGMLPQSPC